MPSFHLRITAADREALTALVRVPGLHVLRPTLRVEAGVVEAIGDLSVVADLRGRGYTVDQLEDVDAAAREGLVHVGRGNRFLDQDGGVS